MCVIIIVTCIFIISEIMPRKITVKEYKEKLQSRDSDSNDEDSS